MAQRVALSGSVSTSPSGASGASGEIVLDSPEESYEDVRQREAFRLSTTGAPGAVFVEIECPPTALQIVLVSKEQANVWARLNGAAAKVTGSTAPALGLADADGFSLQTDTAAVPVAIAFLATDNTLAKAAARINAAIGAIVATVVQNALVLQGALSGDADAFGNGRQFGRLILSSDVGGALAKLGLVAGTTYGHGTDLAFRRRFIHEPLSAGQGSVTRLELSGSGDMTVHLAGN